MPVAYIALGSNLGDRAATLEAALRQLAQTPGIQVLRNSSFYETKPVGGPSGQNAYFNAAAELQTQLSPDELLNRLLQIEEQFGRIREKKNDPRTLDLDVLLFDDLVRWQPDPIVPHPRMHEREFVLAPLAEIAPDVVHPNLGFSVSELLTRLRRGHSHRLDGMRAMVTGSTKGIGRAIAIAFAEAGADVIIHGRTAAQELKDTIEQLGRRSAGVRADLSNIDTYRPLVEQAFERWNGIDIWVNNAGVDVLTGEAAKWPFEKKIAALIDVDVRSTIVLSRLVGDRMRAQPTGGTILNLGWDQADAGVAGDTNQLFSASKGAVMAFTKSLAATLAPTVRVNCIAPGWIKTAWGENVGATWQRKAVEESMLRRWGTPEDVAAAAVWLASPAAQFITGQTINVNGGLAR